MPFFNGLATGAALIIAIGAQNAFVLSNGIKKNHVLTIVLVCCICDAMLIIAGIAGVGGFLSAHPGFTDIMRWGGAAFLLWYAACSLRSALHTHKMEPKGTVHRSFSSVLAATLAVTLLNPHVYLDTVVLVGSIASRFSGSERVLFGLGAICASILWFFALGFGSCRLAPLFRHSTSWKILDVVVGLLMLSLGASLIFHQVAT